MLQLRISRLCFSSSFLIPFMWSPSGWVTIMQWSWMSSFFITPYSAIHFSMLERCLACPPSMRILYSWPVDTKIEFEMTSLLTGNDFHNQVSNDKYIPYSLWLFEHSNNPNGKFICFLIQWASWITNVLSCCNYPNTRIVYFMYKSNMAGAREVQLLEATAFIIECGYHILDSIWRAENVTRKR